jgi:hypothetical protein
LGLVLAGSEQLEMERHDDGVWCYSGTDIAVPGAVDRTLDEIVDVRVVARPGQEPDAVLLARSEVEGNPSLAWVPELGRLLCGQSADQYEVPWPVWQERAVASIGVRAPERDSDGLKRRLAIDERSVRFARSQLEQMTEIRARTIAIASGLGMTRREIGELLGLSAGRVQQVLEDLPTILRSEVDHLLRHVLKVLRHLGSRSGSIEDLTSSLDIDVRAIDELVSFGLLTQRGSLIGVTDAGEQAELHLRTSKRRASSSRG